MLRRGRGLSRGIMKVSLQSDCSRIRGLGNEYANNIWAIGDASAKLKGARGFTASDGRITEFGRAVTGTIRYSVLTLSAWSVTGPRIRLPLSAGRMSAARCKNSRETGRKDAKPHRRSPREWPHDKAKMDPRYSYRPPSGAFSLQERARAEQLSLSQYVP